MDDDLRTLPRSETKYGDRLVNVEDSDPVDCVLCDETSSSPETHEQHMQEVHDL